MFHLFTLVSFIALYTSTFSFGSLAFQFIERLLPDPLSYGGSMLGMGRNAIAGLIVAFPLYLFLMRLIWKETKGNARHLASGVRTWFTYITLVVVAGIMLGDLIAVVSNVLGGELALRFILKAGTIFAIAGAIFGYYLHDLKRRAEDSFSLKAKAFAAAVSALVLLFIAYGIVLTGTPGQQRMSQFDQSRVSDLQQISYVIDSYWQNNGKLPENLEELRDSRLYFVSSITDPETQEPYEYLRIAKELIPEEQKYQLCAVFSYSFDDTYSPYQKGYPVLPNFWNYELGRTCFDLEVQELRKVP